jgi:hypothetical protein
MLAALAGAGSTFAPYRGGMLVSQLLGPEIHRCRSATTP